MIKCFYHTCLILVTVLLASATLSHAQSNFRITPQVIYFDTIYLGTSARDSFQMDQFALTRTLFAAPLDKHTDSTLSLDEPQLYPRTVEADDTIIQGFTATPKKLGLDTLLLAIMDMQGFGDTLQVIINVLQAPPPFAINDQIDLGPIIVGAPINDSFYVRRVDQTVRLRAYVPVTSSRSRESITLITSGPQVVMAGDSMKVRLLIENDSVGSQDLVVHVIDSLTMHVDSISIMIFGLPPTPVDSVFALRPEGRDIFAKIVTTDTATFAVIARNVTDSVFAIEQIIHDDAAHFQIESSLPIIVDPDEAFDLILKSTTLEDGFYPTLVRLPSNGGLASEYSITIQVLRITAMSAPPIYSRSGLRLVQSPTSIAIEGISYERGRIEIFDILGRRITSTEHWTRQAMIDKVDRSGSRIRDGAYFIRLTALDGSRAETLKVVLVGY